jgi:hypothetical protein
MAPRDAFGNEIPERGVGTAPVEGLPPGGPAAPPFVPPPPPAPPSAARSRPAPRPGPRRALVALLVLGAFAVAAAGAVALAHVGRDALRTADHAVAQVHAALPSVPTPSPPAAPPRGTGGGSLLAHGNLDRALARGVRAGSGRLRILRVAPARLDLQFGRADGGLDLVSVDWNSDPRTVHTSSGAAGGPPALRIAAIDREAPARLVRSAAARLHRSTKAIDYLVLMDVLGHPRWTAYFTGGGAFTADAHGRAAHRIS